MKKRSTTVRFQPDAKNTPRLTSAQQKRLDALKDTDIDYTDIPELGDDFLRLTNALTPGPKRPLTLRLDEEVYQWLKEQGPGYQSRINAMLKAIMVLKEQRL